MSSGRLPEFILVILILRLHESILIHILQFLPTRVWLKEQQLLAHLGSFGTPHWQNLYGFQPMTVKIIVSGLKSVQPAHF